MTIAVLGATGKTGKVAAEKLLSAKQKVRVIGRDRTKMASLAARGAEVEEANARDGASLTRAFEGVTSLYAILPPDPQAQDFRAVQRACTDAIVTAVTNAKVKRVVLLSSLGAEHPEGTGPIVGLYELEKRLAAVPGLDALFLRAGYFYENLFGSLPAIKQYGANGGNVAPDVPVKMIASADIGDVVAGELLDGSFKGAQVRDLFAARDYTMTEVTKILGAKIGKPDLGYMQMPDEAMLGALVGAGFSASVAGMYVEMGRAINAGRIVSTQGRTPRTTSPTPFESFADVLAGAYRAM